jgi:YidC/Oxa1 family membrane protein insertase
MNRHIAEVQKKHGVSHSMMLTGMLPTLVQMPIWIALYSAIYASIDLRGAGFLPVWITDLSAPDALFRFPGGFKLPFFGDTFNLLPILMGIAFYLQQKLTPSQATAPTPEAAQQQKIMMLMMPLMFPLMLYKSPSGLNLYIMASVFGGVLEQYVIKNHIKKKEQQKEQGLVAVTSKTGGKLKKKKPKPFFKI